MAFRSCNWRRGRQGNARCCRMSYMVRQIRQGQAVKKKQCCQYGSYVTQKIPGASSTKNRLRSPTAKDCTNVSTLPFLDQDQRNQGHTKQYLKNQ